MESGGGREVEGAVASVGLRNLRARKKTASALPRKHVRNERRTSAKGDSVSALARRSASESSKQGSLIVLSSPSSALFRSTSLSLPALLAYPESFAELGVPSRDSLND